MRGQERFRVPLAEITQGKEVRMADSVVISPRRTDKLALAMTEGLLRAAVQTEGLPLHGPRNSGLFPNSAVGKQAALACLERGYVEVRGIETQGKKPVELYGITPSGLEFLLGQISPREVLTQIAQAVASRIGPLQDIERAVASCRREIEAFRHRIDTLLTHLPTQPEAILAALTGSWQQTALEFLERWQAEKPNEDCPLPDLFAQARSVCPALTLGQFHDGLRRLHDEGRIYLHPWTGPLYEIPEPACALLIGHAVAYYASPRPMEEQAAA